MMTSSSGRGSLAIIGHCWKRKTLKGNKNTEMQLLMELLCSAMTLIYATNPYTVQLIPKGDCEHCCPLHRGDMKLYLNIYEFGREMEFDWENGSDWRYLLNNRTNIIYIHGFTEQASGPAASELRQAFMSRGQENFIVVDWSPLAAAPWYHSAVANTHRVSAWLASVIDSLVIRGLPLESIHLIGFSLGAEIAGQTAKQITVGKLRRVTGLDPALPLFHELDPSSRIAYSDADFVDVIHTDGAVFGFYTPLGHADFFPNGGKPAQPGCKIETVIHTGKLNEFVACSHNRAWKFYAESVRNPYAFPAYKCSDYQSFESGKCPKQEKQAYMGYFVDPSLRGTFFLDTRTSAPFGLGYHEEQTNNLDDHSTQDHQGNPEEYEESNNGHQHHYHVPAILRILESKGEVPEAHDLSTKSEDEGSIPRARRQDLFRELQDFNIPMDYDELLAMRHYPDTYGKFLSQKSVDYNILPFYEEREETYGYLRNYDTLSQNSQKNTNPWIYEQETDY